jgi:outer membrane protein TolC
MISTGENWTAGILFNWELFQGFYTRADENEARAIFEEMLLRDRKTTLAVELEVKTAYLGLTDARARLEVARQRVANAEESLNFPLSRAEHRRGGREKARGLSEPANRRASNRVLRPKPSDSAASHAAMLRCQACVSVKLARVLTI